MIDYIENKRDERTGLEVAVIGMAGKFPGAESIDEFWENLGNGVESIAFFTDEELEAEGINQKRFEDPNFVKARGIVKDVEYFDSYFFGYTPSESEMMHPQLRIFYECTWWALENAGYSPDSYKGNIGIYGGATSSRSWDARAIFSGKTDTLGMFASDHLIDRDFLCTRIAYRLNLTGPAITMKTACSTGLVAVGEACRALLTGQCDIALAGASSFLGSRKSGYIYSKGMIQSPDGHVRAFDADAGGVVFSDGVGVVVLKTLEDALNDGDNILAVIKGTAANNDGSRKGTFSAPSIEGQAGVIRAALDISEVDPETIGYVEAHGTGTELGDPVEIKGLKLAFDTTKRDYCAIGSVKTNVGHLDTAAGIAGFIKAVLVLHHKLIPPTLHYLNPNPKIDFENSPFYVNTQLREWERGDYPRRAGVSSFGIGGTNAHAVLEEAPGCEPSPGNRKHHLILLSAKTGEALDQMTWNFLGHLEKNPSLNLADAAYTLQVGRSSFQHRQMFMASGVEEAVALLSPRDNAGLFSLEKVQRSLSKEVKRPVFMFSGQGSQYVDMGLELYREEPGFAEEMDRCFEIFQAAMGYDLKGILYPGLKAPGAGAADHGKIDRTEIAQPVIFILEYALAKLLMKLGVFPYTMIGHSIGEYTAACLAGVFSLEDAIRLVAVRGKLMQKMSKGAMLSVPLPESELTPMLKDGLELAAVNGSALCVVSGPEEPVHRFADRLKEKGLQVRLLHTSHAFHSRSMEPMLKEFEAEVAGVVLNMPGIPYISNLSGTWITEEEAVDPDYWARHLRHTVRFGDGLAELLKVENALLIEVGPGRALSTFARSHPDKKEGHMIVNLVRHPGETISDTLYFMDKLGRLWLYGLEIDWSAFYSRETRYRIPLPLYPFQRESYWIDSSVLDDAKIGAGQKNTGTDKKLPFEKWFYIPSWRRTAIPEPDAGDASSAKTCNWLFFMDNCGIGKQLAGRLREEGHEVIDVFNGQTFNRLENGGFAVNPGRAGDYVALLNALKDNNKTPHRVVHLWNITGVTAADESPVETGSDTDETQLYLDNGFYSLLYLVQAMDKQNINEEMRLTIFTDQVHEVTGEEKLCPQKAVVLGPVKTIPLEFPNIHCSHVDIVLPRNSAGSHGEKKLLGRLLREIKAGTVETGAVVAYRHNHRLVLGYEPAELAGVPGLPSRLREEGVYLVTGGLGGIGLVLARYLAEHVRARLILTGRSPFPGREEWDAWLSSKPVDDPTSRKIRQVKELEILGAKVLVFSVDVTDHNGMADALERARGHFGPINGVIHAAGVPGGGIIPLKTREMADRVLMPKVKGTLVLDNALKDVPLDFICLCSSISSVLPTAGQVDYFAANAFLDAYAYSKTTTDGIFTASINWDPWQEVGMAVEAVKSETAPPPEPQPLEIEHPLLEQYVDGTGENRKYITHLGVEKHWPLKDHMTADGRGLLPGTTYLEMARAAYEDYAGSGPVEIYDVNFNVPMLVEKDEVREVHLSLEKRAGLDYYQFTVESIVPTEVNFLLKHAIGKIRPLKVKEEVPPVFDIAEIKTACNVLEINADERKTDNNPEKKQQGLLVFGPHWKNRQWAKFGKTEGLVEFQLPDEFVGELEQYKLHPSLLDTATGFMFGYIHKGSAYIPFAYKRLRMFCAFPGKIICYSRLMDASAGRKEFLKFNVTIMDEHGNVCADIEEFTMLEVSEGMKNRIITKEKTVSGARAAAPGESSTVGLNERQRWLRKRGIHPLEGVDACKCILNGENPQVVVSTTNLLHRLEVQKVSLEERHKKNIPESGSTSAKHSRPGISSTYVQPRTELEEQITRVWQDFLGIEGLGINDDFFELGGDSLKALALLPKIHQGLDVEIPLAEFFNRPTVEKLSEYIQGAKKEAYVSIEPTEKKDYYSISPAQKGLFIHMQLSVESLAYNESLVLNLDDDFPVAHTETLFKKIIERHESFRTSFEIVDEEPVQRIHDNVTFEIEYFDPGTEGHANTIKNFVRPFDLSRPPLMRAGLSKIGDHRHVLLIDIHHIIADGRSFGIFIEELAALQEGKELPELRLQYKDFSEWQKGFFEKQQAGMNRQKEYWLNKFKDQVPLLKLPTDYPRPTLQSYEGSQLFFELAPDRTKKLKEIASKEDLTLFMLLFGIFSILLSKLSMQEDIVIGSPILGRNHPEVQPIIGMFVNTLALRSFPAGDKRFSRFLLEMKEAMVEMLDNQGYPFDELVEQLGIPWDVGMHPLFNVTFAMLNTASGEAGPQEQTEPKKRPDILAYNIENRMSKFDLGLETKESDNKIFLTFVYCTKLFKKETVEQFIINFNEIINTVSENTNIRLKDIAISHGLFEQDSIVPEVDFRL